MMARMRAGGPTVVVALVSMAGAAGTGCGGGAGAKASGASPPLAPPAFVGTVEIPVAAAGVSEWRADFFGEARLDGEAGASFAAFVAGARGALGGRAPGHLGVRAARVEVVGAKVGSVSVEPRTRTLVASLALVVDGSAHLHLMAGSTTEARGGSLPLEPVWEAGDVNAADGEAILAGRTTAIARGVLSDERPLRSGTTLELRFVLELEAYAAAQPSLRRFGSPGARCPGPVSGGNCGQPTPVDPWDAHCEEIARDQCEIAARCCGGAPVDPGACREQAFSECRLPIATVVGYGSVFDAGAAARCRAARRAVVRGCAEGRGRLADVNGKRDCDRVVRSSDTSGSIPCGRNQCPPPGPGRVASCMYGGEGFTRCTSHPVVGPGQACGASVGPEYVGCVEPYRCVAGDRCSFPRAEEEACATGDDCWWSKCEGGRCAAGPPLMSESACQHAAGAGATLVHGAFETLAIDGGQLFFMATDGDARDLATAGVEGGRPRPLVRLLGVRAPLVPAGDQVYFLADPPDYRRPPAFFRAPRAGGPALAMPLPGSAGASPRFAVDGDELFTAADHCALIGRGRLSGGAFSVSFSREAQVHPSDTDGPLLALDGDSLYCVSSQRFWRAPRAGGPLELLATLEGSFHLKAAALAGGSFAFTRLLPPDATGRFATGLYVLPATGGEPRLVNRTGDSVLDALAMDATRRTAYVLVSRAQEGIELRAISLDDGSPTTLAISDVAEPVGLVADERFLYYRTREGVRRLAK
jgi:hypothetical protein